MTATRVQKILFRPLDIASLKPVGFREVMSVSIKMYRACPVQVDWDAIEEGASDGRRL